MDLRARSLSVLGRPAGPGPLPVPTALSPIAALFAARELARPWKSRVVDEDNYIRLIQRTECRELADSDIAASSSSSCALPARTNGASWLRIFVYSFHPYSRCQQERTEPS